MGISAIRSFSRAARITISVANFMPMEEEHSAVIF
jgi:hypothetical protein